MSIQDVKENLELCKRNIASHPWGIIQLYDGKFDGSGYGHNLTSGDFSSCAQAHTLIMTNHDNVDQQVESCRPSYMWNGIKWEGVAPTNAAWTPCGHVDCINYDTKEKKCYDFNGGPGYEV